MKIFNWDDFKEERIAVSLNTKEKFLNFVECANRRDAFRWWEDDTSLKVNSILQWHEYKEKTCVHADDTQQILYRGKKSDYKKDKFKIIDWEIVNLDFENSVFYDFLKRRNVVEIKNWEDVLKFMAYLTPILGVRDFLILLDDESLIRNILENKTICIGSGRGLCMACDFSLLFFELEDDEINSDAEVLKVQDFFVASKKGMPKEREIIR